MRGAYLSCAMALAADAADDAYACALHRVEATWRAAQEGNVPALEALLCTFRADSLHIAGHASQLQAACSRRFGYLVDVAATNDWPEIVRVAFASEHVPVYRKHLQKRTFMLAAAAGSIGVVSALLQGKVSVDARNSQGTPLAFAARHGQDDVVRLLLEAGSCVNLRDDHDFTPLTRALRHAGNGTTVALLLEAKAHVNVQDPAVVPPKQEPLYNALHCPSFVRVLLEAKALLRGTELSAVARQAPVRYTLGDDEVSETVRLLLAAKASVGANVLVRAASTGHVGLVQQLLSASTCTGDDHTREALGQASEAGHVHIVRLLLEAKACPNAPDWHDLVPLENAALRPGGVDVVRVLLDAKASVAEPGGRTALHTAVTECDNVDTVRVLLEAKADPNGDVVDTPLCNAAQRPANTANIAALLAAKALVNPGTADLHVPQSTPLLAAAWVCCTLNVRVILDAKAQVNVQDARGRTPLFSAALRESERVVRMPLDAKADVDIADHAGKRSRDFDVVRRFMVQDLKDTHAKTRRRRGARSKLSRTKS